MTDTAPTRQETLRAVLGDVLADLRFPARPWQVITTAETYGADHRIRTALHTLRAPRYATLDDVVSELARSGAAVLAPRAAPPPFTAPPSVRQDEHRREVYVSTQQS